MGNKKPDWGRGLKTFPLTKAGHTWIMAGEDGLTGLEQRNGLTGLEQRKSDLSSDPDSGRPSLPP